MNARRLNAKRADLIFCNTLYMYLAKVVDKTVMFAEQISKYPVQLNNWSPNYF